MRLGRLIRDILLGRPLGAVSPSGQEAVVFEIELPPDLPSLLNDEAGNRALFDIENDFKLSPFAIVHVELGTNFLAFLPSKALLPTRSVTRFWVSNAKLHETYSDALHLCRAVQVRDLCDGLFARYVRYEMSTNAQGQRAPRPLTILKTPFTSECARGFIPPGDPVHPDRADRKSLTLMVDGFDCAVAELIGDPEKLFRVSPKEFEQLLSAVYRARGFDVTMTAGPRDHGIDISANISVPFRLPGAGAQRISVAVQAKRYKKTHNVGEAKVREFFGSVVAAGYDHGVLVTTSSLTAPARAFIETRRPVQDRISINAGSEVLELLVSYCRASDQPFWVPKRLGNWDHGQDGPKSA